MPLHLLPAHNIQDVIVRMEQIESALPTSDGVKWFNRLYLLVIRNLAVDLETPSKWKSTPWITAMVPTFANLYFSALNAHALGEPVAHAWQPLLKRRHDKRIFRLQFSIAGMAAHINRDLPHALRATLELLRIPVRSTENDPALAAVHHDYLLMNEVLAAAEIQSRTDQSLELVSDLPLDPDPDLAPIEDVLDMWNVRKAREIAWENTKLLRAAPITGEPWLQQWDQLTGAFARGMLAPLKAPHPWIVQVQMAGMTTPPPPPVPRWRDEPTPMRSHE